MNDATCLVDGFGPLPVERPGSVQELGDLVRQATAGDFALYPLGGQTTTTLGQKPTKPGRAVDLRDLDRVIDFPARDMTVTVQAGITIKTLQEILAKENLRLPIDVPQADRSTLGGILATNTSGPRRLGYGTLRDYVIGISAVNDEGSEFKAGGRVVKNVAGYDLCKLLVGSLGTLGIITQATLKLRPLAEQQALLSLACAPDRLETMLAGLHNSQTRPVCVELLDQAAAQVVYAQASLVALEGPWVIVVGYEGNAEAVSWQVQQLVKEVGAQCRLQARVDFTANPLWQALIEFAAWPTGATVFKANLLPSAVASFCRDADSDANRPALRAHAGSGIVCGHWPNLSEQDAGQVLAVWRERARKGQGSVVVCRCPAEWKPGLDVWGPAPASADLMREVKAWFDPRRVFNPGRFIGGI
jgi:glycolate oxidase FAD binding subunit